MSPVANAEVSTPASDPTPISRPKLLGAIFSTAKPNAGIVSALFERARPTFGTPLNVPVIYAACPFVIVETVPL